MSLLLVSACALKTTGVLERDASLPDASAPDASLGDAASDVSFDRRGDEPRDGSVFDGPLDAGLFLCGDAEVSSCAGCEAGAAACPVDRTCVSDCFNQCGDGGLLGCFECTGGVALGKCEPPATASCLLDASYPHCACVNANDCPGGNQVCLGIACLTCGEPLTDTEVCRAGTGMKKCKANDPNLDNRYRCK